MKTTKTAREIFEAGLIDVMGANDSMPSGTYSDTFYMDLKPTQSGEVESVTLYTTHTGTGAIHDLAGTLLFFDDAPQISGSMSALTWEARQMVLGQVAIASTDWTVDASGASVSKHLAGLMPFHQLDRLYMAFRNEDGDGFNSDADDNEILKVNLWYARCGRL